MSANASPTAASGGSGRWIIAAVLVLVAVAAGAAIAVSQSADDTTAGAPDTTTATGEVDEPSADEATSTTAPDSSPGVAMDPVHIFADDVVLGSWTGGQWTVNPEVAPALDGSVISYVEGAQVQEATVVGPSESWCEVLDAPSWYVPLGSAPTIGGLYGMTNLTWNPRPQSVTDIAPSAAHLEAAADALAQAGLPDAEIEISRIVRLDIEGDGVDEVVLTAQVGEPDFYGSRVGDYSVMILRQVNDSEQVDNLVLGVHATTGTEPGAELAEDLGGSPGVITISSTYFEFVDAIDLNGDGTLELLTTQSGYEWFAREVIDTSSGQPEVVLSSGCGA